MANFMGHDSEFMESFLKASAQTKRTDTGVTKIKKLFVMYIFGVPHTATLSGILKAKQKLGRTFNSDKLGGIAFTKISKLTMCSAQEEAQTIVPASTGTAHAQF